MVKIGGKKKTDEEIINYPEPDYIEDELDLLPTAPQKKVKPKKDSKSPDDLFTEFQEQYHLPIYLTRKDLEQNPKNIKEINDLPSDIRQIMIRYKRSKNDMDLYYKMTKRMETN